MKKLVLLFALVCFIQPFCYSQIVHCEFEGMGNVDWIVVNFDDPDGDCKSDNY